MTDMLSFLAISTSRRPVLDPGFGCFAVVAEERRNQAPCQARGDG
jgi:hypothetical protein